MASAQRNGVEVVDLISDDEKDDEDVELQRALAESRAMIQRPRQALAASSGPSSSAASVAAAPRRPRPIAVPVADYHPWIYDFESISNIQFHNYQLDVLEQWIQNAGERTRFIDHPMGSGKSLLVIAMAYLWIRAYGAVYREMRQTAVGPLSRSMLLSRIAGHLASARRAQPSTHHHHQISLDYYRVQDEALRLRILLVTIKGTLDQYTKLMIKLGLYKSLDDLNQDWEFYSFQMIPFRQAVFERNVRSNILIIDEQHRLTTTVKRPRTKRAAKKKKPDRDDHEDADADEMEDDMHDDVLWNGGAPKQQQQGRRSDKDEKQDEGTTANPIDLDADDEDMVPDEKEAKQIKPGKRPQTVKILLDAAPSAGRVMLLTGTPIVNDLVDIQHAALLMANSAAEQAMIRKNVLRRKKRPWSQWGEEEKDTLRSVFECRYSLVQPNDVDLSRYPRRRVTAYLLEMDQAYRDAYDSIEAEVFENSALESVVDRKFKFYSGLRRAANALIGESGGVVSRKGDLLLELLRPRLRQRQKILMYSFFKERGIHIFMRKLDEAHIAYAEISGDTRPKQRQQILAEFANNDPSKRSFDILIITSAGGTGLNLPGVRMQINFDQPWNPATKEQTNARAHRCDALMCNPPEERTLDIIELYLVRTEELEPFRLRLLQDAQTYPGIAPDDVRIVRARTVVRPALAAGTHMDSIDMYLYSLQINKASMMASWRNWIRPLTIEQSNRCKFVRARRHPQPAAPPPVVKVYKPRHEPREVSSPDLWSGGGKHHDSDDDDDRDRQRQRHHRHHHHHSRYRRHQQPRWWLTSKGKIAYH